MLDYSYKGILKVALPLMLGAFIQSAVLITDSAFLSRLGTIPFDAAGNAGLIYITLFMLSAGITDGSQILIARNVGSINLRRMGSIVHHSFIFQMILSCLLFLLILLFIKDLLPVVTLNKEIASTMNEFLSIRKWGYFFACLQGVLMSYLLGTARTKIVIYAMICMGSVNIVLDYGLVFGELGLPKMGVQGAALASVIAEFCGTLTLLLYIIFSRSRYKLFIFNRFNFQPTLIKFIAKISTPLMIQGLFAMGAWTIFFGMIEYMGSKPLEISQVIRSVYFLAFVPLFGFAATTKTYVSHYYAQNNLTAIKTIQKRVIILNTISILILFHGALLYPEYLVPIINNNPDILESSSIIMKQIFGSVILFGITSVFFNTVSGLGLTHYSLYIEILSLILYQFAAYLMIMQWQMSIEKIWYIEYLYFTCLGLFSYLFLKFSRHKIY